MKFSSKQQEVFDEIMHFFLESDEEIYIFSGVAGSGKSTIINEINNMLKSEYGNTVAVITLTGKAVSTLKDKGIIGAQTIHSYMYTPIVDIHDNLVGFEPIAPSELTEDFIIIDEGSMVNEEIFEDVYNLGKKILVVGDVNQLPPISKTNFNIMEESNFRLEEIHRLAEGNPIIMLSQHILEYGSLPKRFESEHIRFTKRNQLKTHLEKHGKDYEIILCGTNKVRNTLNKRMRSVYDYHGQLPMDGERIINLQNDKNQGIFNGEMFKVHKQYPYEYKVKDIKQEMTKYVIKDNNDFYHSVLVHDDVWGNGEAYLKYIFEYNEYLEKSEKRTLNKFDFGYAVTVWKSQGSEYQNLMFVDEDVSYFVDRGKFRYTAITRSKDKITIGI